jgi:hypothetical protein
MNSVERKLIQALRAQAVASKALRKHHEADLMVQAADKIEQMCDNLEQYRTTRRRGPW